MNPEGPHLIEKVAMQKVYQVLCLDSLCETESLLSSKEGGFNEIGYRQGNESEPIEETKSRETESERN